MSFNIEDYFCNLINTSNLYLLCSPPGFGKHKLFMYISHLYAERHMGHSLVHSLEMSEQQWKNEMALNGFDMSGLYIDDNACCSVEDIRKNIKLYSPVIVMIHYLGLLEDEDSIPKLKQLAKDYSIPIIVSLNLGRNCGDRDPMYRRPQLFDLIYTNYYSKKTIDELREDIYGSEIIFLHRNHDCDRSIGSAYRYNFSSTAELIINNNTEIFSGPQSIFFNYDYIFNDDNPQCTGDKIT